MTKKKYPERRLLVISKRRKPTDEGLARLIAAMVLYQAEQQQSESGQQGPSKDSA